MSSEEQTIAAELLALLACPEDGGPLVWDARERVLHNPRLRLAYPSLGGVPRLTPSSAVSVDVASSEGLSRDA